MEDNFVVTPEALRRRRKQCAEKEQLLFLALCSKKDRKLITGEAELNVHDYERICYLLERMGLNHLLLYFEFEHEDFMMEISKRIEAELECSEKPNLSEEIDLINQWSSDFCNQLPTPVMKHYMKILFYLE